MTHDNGQNQGEKGEVIDFTHQGSIDDQAANWVAKLDFDEPSKETLAAFKQWINQSPEHKAAFEEYVGVWDQVNILSQLEPPRERKAHEAANETGGFYFGRRPLLALCSFVVVCVLAVQVFIPSGQAIYQTEIGAQQLFTLPDGSTALLNTNSAIEVDYTDKRRLITLSQGEAHFDVVKNPDKPFEVYAGKGLVRAVGTAFSVHLRKNDVEVVVTEGIVQIDPATLSKPDAIKPTHPRVTAGSAATYDRHTAKHVILAELEKIEEITSWHKGLLIFDDEPLENVVAEVGRYTSTQIHIPEEKVRQLKVGGQFKIGDTEAMFEALKISFDIQAGFVSDDLVYLVRSEAQ